MATPRAVRIRRSSPEPETAAPLAGATPAPPAAGPAAVPGVERRENRGASQRAFRLTAIYLVALVALYLVFVLVDRDAPGGTGPAAATGLLYFTAFASALAVGGVVICFGSVPRAVEVSESATVVVEWWGRRRAFPPLAELHAEVVRRLPPGLLSSRPVEMMELGERRKGRRTYQFEEGLIPERRSPALAP
ncbi:MAG: hypothetical protein WBE40_04645 [Thermoplasmata archaeon]